VKPIEVAVIGAGNRGRDSYGEIIRRSPHDMRIVAVAEPNERRRRRLAAEHEIPEARCYAGWETMLEEPRFCDAVLICTGDRQHYDPALAAIDRGYHVLLEKPMSTEPAECLAISDAAERAGVVLVVAHVLRYAPLFGELKALLDRKAVGDLISIQHNENVGFYHFAHSYVRGNWRRNDESSPIVLAKSCHDMDILYWFAGSRCRAVSSFGRLMHFRPENAPPGSTDRCLDGCPHLHTCPYSAARIYLERDYEWPVTAVTDRPDLQSRTEALRTGPYGRCVYRSDNDVVDNQVASLHFENGVSVAFVLSGFTHDISRTMKLMGSHGEIRAHMERNEITLHRFCDGSVRTIHPGRTPGSHGGGDGGLLRSFVQAVRNPDAQHVVTSARDSAEGHLIAFAAEEARKTGQVVSMEDYLARLS